MTMSSQDYFILIAIWSCWCAMHSFLISSAVMSFMEQRFGGYDRWYRIFYNIFSLVTLAAPVYYLKSLHSPTLFKWQGSWLFIRFSLLLLAFVLFREGARKYRLTSFLGLDQLRTGKRDVLLNGQTTFSRSGVFGIIRHPWYGGSILLVWSGAQVYSIATSFVAVVLTIYLVAGTYLEERKLMAEYGEEFRAYQRDVSMLFPWKWLKGAWG
ncbi:methyltransferase family protein [Desulfomarina sp.]